MLYLHSVRMAETHPSPFYFYALTYFRIGGHQGSSSSFPDSMSNSTGKWASLHLWPWLEETVSPDTFISLQLNTGVLCVTVALYSTWQVRTKRVWPAYKTITLLKEVHYPKMIWSYLLILPFYLRLLNAQLQEKPNHMLKSILKYKLSL